MFDNIVITKQTIYNIDKINDNSVIGKLPNQNPVLLTGLVIDS